MYLRCYYFVTHVVSFLAQRRFRQPSPSLHQHARASQEGGQLHQSPMCLRQVWPRCRLQKHWQRLAASQNVGKGDAVPAIAQRHQSGEILLQNTFETMPCPTAPHAHKEGRPARPRRCASAALFYVLRDQCNACWAAVLSLLQLCIGDRCSAALAVKVGWLDISPTSGGPPTISIPDEVNGKTKAKTKARMNPLPDDLARMLHGWLFTTPLVSRNTCERPSQWPFPGQSRLAGSLLFPGLVLNPRNPF